MFTAVAGNQSLRLSNRKSTCKPSLTSIARLFAEYLPGTSSNILYGKLALLSFEIISGYLL
jgi:hypothetical protein